MTIGPLNTVTRFEQGGFAEREKMKSEPFYDPQLAIRVSRLLGPGFQHALDPRRKRFLKTDFPINLHGMYTLPSETGTAMTYPYSEGSRGESIHDILVPEKDTVYQFGEQPSATTLSHEYRHRAGIHNEYTNRLYDALYAETDEDWKDAVHFWRDQLQRGSSKRFTKEEAEKDLVNQLEKKETELRRWEWESAPEGQKPQHSDPTFGGWLHHILNTDKWEYAGNPPPAYYKKRIQKSRGGLAALRTR